MNVFLTLSDIYLRGEICIVDSKGTRKFMQHTLLYENISSAETETFYFQQSFSMVLLDVVFPCQLVIEHKCEVEIIPLK